MKQKLNSKTQFWFLSFSRMRLANFYLLFNRNHKETLLAPYYLKLLIQNTTQGSISEKIALSMDKQHYAVFIMPIVQNQWAIAYSISFVNENDFVSSIPLINSKYIITDSFGNIYSVILINLHNQLWKKFDEIPPFKNTLVPLKIQFWLKNIKVDSNFSIYHFQSFFPIPNT